MSIIFSLNPSKSVGPYGMPTKILALLKDGIYIIFLTSMISLFSCMCSNQSGKLSKSFWSSTVVTLVQHLFHQILKKKKRKKKEGLVYKKIIKFLNDNNLIYLSQFGVLHSYSTNHASNNLKDMGKDLDEGKVGCGIFVDLQKTFDTGEHNVLLEKLEHYGICGIANKSFKSYPSDRTQFASINGFISSHAMLMEFSKAL